MPRRNRKQIAQQSALDNVAAMELLTADDPEVAKQQKQAEELGRLKDAAYQREQRHLAAAEGRAEAIAEAKTESQFTEDPALTAARQRALGRLGGQAAAEAPRKPSARASEPDRLVTTAAGDRVPQSILDQGPSATAAFRKRVKEAEAQKDAQNHFERTNLSMLQIIEKQAQKLSKVEDQLATAMTAIDTLNTALQAVNTSVQINETEGLSKARGDLGQQITNAAAVSAKLQLDAEANRVEAENIQVAQANQLQAITTAKDEAIGRLDGARKLSDATREDLLAKTADVESRLSTAQQELTALQDQVDVIGKPMTRPEIEAMVQSAVIAEARSALPELVDQRLAEDRESGVYSPGGMSKDRAAVEQRREDAKRFEAQRYGDELERSRLA